MSTSSIRLSAPLGCMRIYSCYCEGNARMCKCNQIINLGRESQATNWLFNGPQNLMTIILAATHKCNNKIIQTCYVVELDTWTTAPWCDRIWICCLIFLWHMIYYCFEFMHMTSGLKFVRLRVWMIQISFCANSNCRKIIF